MAMVHAHTISVFEAIVFSDFGVGYSMTVSTIKTVFNYLQGMRPCLL